MNLITAANDLKGLSDQQLQQQLLNPSGMFPSFLALGELQRRKEARNDYAARQQGGAPQKSMAEEYAQGIGGQSNSNYANAVKQGEQGGVSGQPPEGMNDPMQSMGQMGQPMGQAPQMPSQQPPGFALGGAVGPARMYDPNTSNFLPYIIKHGAPQPEPVTPGPPPILHPEPTPAPTPAPAPAPPPVAQGLAVLAQSLGGDGGSGNAAGADGGGGAGNGAGGGVGTAAGAAAAAAAAATGEDGTGGGTGSTYRWGGGIRRYADGGGIEPSGGFAMRYPTNDGTYWNNPAGNAGAYFTAPDYFAPRLPPRVMPLGVPQTRGLIDRNTPVEGSEGPVLAGPAGRGLQRAWDATGDYLGKAFGPGGGALTAPRSFERPGGGGGQGFAGTEGGEPQPYQFDSDVSEGLPAALAAGADPNGGPAAPAGGPAGPGTPAGPPGGSAGVRSGGNSAIGTTLADYYGQMQAIKLPDRYAELAKQNAEDKAAVGRDRESSKGEALLTAGLAMAAGRSPNAITNIGEGGLAGVKNWNESTKELRQAARDVRNADQAIAIAQANRDERGLENAMKLKQHAEDLHDRALTRASSSGDAAANRAAMLHLKELELKDSSANRSELREQSRINEYGTASSRFITQADAMDMKAATLSANLGAGDETKAQVAQLNEQSRQLRQQGQTYADLHRQSILDREVRLGKIQQFKTGDEARKAGLAPGTKFLDGNYNIRVAP